MLACPFCTLPPERILLTSAHGIVICDGYAMARRRCKNRHANVVMVKHACFAGSTSTENRLTNYGVWAGSTNRTGTRNPLSSLRYFRKYFQCRSHIHTPTTLQGLTCGIIQPDMKRSVCMESMVHHDLGLTS